MDRLSTGKPILMDGALGTELERRAVPIEGIAWSAVAVAESGEIIQQVHEDYIRSGAELHIVNSFALGRHVLEPVGMAGDFALLNHRSVALFDESVRRLGRGRNEFFVAGSLSTFAANSDRSLLPEKNVLLNNYQDQAKHLVDAGVDLFALEMLFDIDVSKTMLDAVKEFSLPVIVGLTCEWGDQSNGEVTTRGSMGRPVMGLTDVLPNLIDYGNNDNKIFSIMHSEMDVTDAALEILQNYWDGPVAIYPNSGQFHNLKIDFESVCSPDNFSQAVARWTDAGVNIVGGCCGIGPKHIQGIRDLFE